MFNKSREVRYLDNLLVEMTRVQRGLIPSAPPDRVGCEAHIASTLATLVSLRAIADVVAAHGPSAAVQRRMGRADRVLGRARDEAWQLVSALNLSWSNIEVAGRDEADKYLQHLGGDSIYEHEYGRSEDFACLRREAARVVLPDSEATALTAVFWSIVGPDFDEVPGAGSRGREAQRAAAPSQDGSSPVTFLDLRREAAAALDPVSVMALEGLGADDLWRMTVEGSTFLAFPARPMSDPSVNYDDVYQHRLAEQIDMGPWFPRAEVDALARAQVARFLLLLQSADDDRRYALLGVSRHDVVNVARELEDMATDRVRQLKPLNAATRSRWMDEMSVVNDHAYSAIGSRQTNPVLGTADHVVADAATTLLFADVQRSFSDQDVSPKAAAFTLAFMTRLWGVSPFRDRLATLPSPEDLGY